MLDPKLRKALWLLVSVLLLSGCAGAVDYKVLGGQIRSDNCEAATAYVKEKEPNYGPNRRLLFLLDAAQVHMLCGDYGKSNEYFHEAEELAEELWTKSITKEAAAFITNDYALPYRGEDFERALINLFSAINYSLLGERDEALVECRRLDSNLSLYNQKYEEKNVYKEDAFGRYLSGIIYESAGSLDDAYIDYYKAYKVFRDYNKDYGTPMPSLLADDLLRLASATHRTDEVRSEFGLSGSPAVSRRQTRNLGRVVLIHLNGVSPVKTEDSVIVPSPSGPIKIAFPRYVVKGPSCRESRMVLTSGSGTEVARAELVEDINAIAVKNLADRKGRVIAKTLVRAAVKQAAIHGATSKIEDKAARDATRLLLNIVNLAVERADTRSWRTLPGEVYLSSVFVPAGKYSVSAGRCGGREIEVGAVEVGKGKTKFVLLNTMY